MTHFWVRAEYRDDEYRTPITPMGAKKLLNSGINITIEENDKRVFSIDEYQSIGCAVASQGAWMKSARETIVLGLKELRNEMILNHRHVMFAHAYKGQSNSKQTLACFKKGGGILYDLEYLTDVDGKRVAAFGHYAGFAGAAVGLNIWLDKKDRDLHSNSKFPLATNKNAILSILKDKLSRFINKNNYHPRAIIIGAHGRVGTGARELFNSMSIKTTNWDIEQTGGGGPFPEILNHDIFVNCVLASPLSKPFVNKELLKLPRRLLVISDVSCDPGSKHNTIPLYDNPTSFEMPYHFVNSVGDPLYVTAIDNLPAMLPRESSLDFEKQILTYLLDFTHDNHGVWKRAKKVFDHHIKEI